MYSAITQRAAPLTVELASRHSLGPSSQNPKPVTSASRCASGELRHAQRIHVERVYIKFILFGCVSDSQLRALGFGSDHWNGEYQPAHVAR